MGRHVNGSSPHSFDKVPRADIQRSHFPRSHTFKTTFDAGKLIPIYVDEVLPGDTIKVNPKVFARLTSSALKVPIMDNIYLDWHAFFIPNRLIWRNWEHLMGSQDTPDWAHDTSANYLVPQVTAPAGGFPIHSLGDYFGAATGVDGVSISALPFRAYDLVFNEWFRDENLMPPRVYSIEDGGDSYSSGGTLAPRCKRADYFTKCLPAPQKGPGVELPLSGTLPVNGIMQYPNQTVTGMYTDPMSPGQGDALHISYGTATTALHNEDNILVPDNDNPTGSRFLGISSAAVQPSPAYAIGFNNLGVQIPGLTVNYSAGATVNLGDALSVTINDLRTAFQMQRLYERDARGGTRYTELLTAHFGVHSPDSRLQRPEYLGSSTCRVNTPAIAQTSSTDSASPQGNLAAIGVASNNSGGFRYSAVEHGWIMVLASARADLTYQQGIPRMYSRRTRYDYYWPVLAHLGEQAVLNKEIYATGTATDDDVFGYQERWAEYRYFPNQITGLFRSTAPTSLDSWHVAQEFSNTPTLSADFIREDPALDRVVAVLDEPKFIFEAALEAHWYRPMPVYSVPGMIDHF